MFLNINSWSFTDGPPMKEVKHSHSCITTFLGSSKVVLVAGGYNGNENLDTVELYDPLKNKWTLHSAKLPLPLQGLQMVNSHSLNYLVYVIGGFGNSNQKTIYGFSRTEKWKLVGNLNEKYRSHASLNIRTNDILGCNWFFVHYYVS